ncbi:GTP 3',8-cyclase MoaA [Lewinellaceae bacterium SD302]|nr:GTP 3',8-cyclase MoaA [Lewinellaceae bacterium SD302]
MLSDRFQRKHTYLRLAVTDRCNLRCRYCMPAEGINFAPRQELLTYEEMLRLTGVLKRYGLKKVRLTGGEPLARRGVETLLRGLATQGLSIHLTTNAILLQPFIGLFQDIHVAGLNISLDTLQPERFKTITRRDEFSATWKNLLAALEAGLPVKINCVFMRGVNDDELVDFARLTQHYPIDVRFIEAMPFNAGDGNQDVYISAADIHARLLAALPNLKSAETNFHSATDRYTVPDWPGGIGIIPAYSRSRCGSCNRIRLTPQGELLNCLYATDGLQLRSILRAGGSDEDLIHLINEYLGTKAINGHEAERLAGLNGRFASMTTIGG